MRKFVPVFCILLLFVVLLTTASFAWLSMNDHTRATGMQINTLVSTSILVSEINEDPLYNPGLTQDRTAVLQPVSSIDGSAFFYTVNAVATGAKNTGNYVGYTETAGLNNDGAGKTKYDAAFNTAYKVQTPVTTGTVVYGYVEYVFYLKATNATDVAAALNMTKCNLLYNGQPIAVDNGAEGLAVRVAVFSQPAEQNTEKAGDGNLVTILKLQDAGNFTSNRAVKNESSLDTVTNANANAVIDSEIAAGATEYHKVVVRLWVEGEDASCNNETYVQLTNAWSLDLKFELGGSVVNKLGSVSES